MQKGTILSDEQQQALNRLIEFSENDEPIIVLSGSAGTGKTFCLKEYIKFLRTCNNKHPLGFNYALCAPTHKAKLVLEEATGQSAITVHKLLSMAPNIEIFNLDYDDLKFRSNGLSEVPIKGIVIIDEASMINDEIYKLLVDVCKRVHSKLVFIMDVAQLQPVNGYGVTKVNECTNKIVLTQIHRQSADNGLMPLLTKLRTDIVKTFNPIDAAVGSLYIYNNGPKFVDAAVEHFRSAVRHQNISECKIACYTNARVRGFNKAVRNKLWEQELEYHQFEFLTGYENFDYDNNQFYNSSDYLIASKPVARDKKIPEFMKLPGYNLELYDPVNKDLLNVFIISKDVPDDYLESLAEQIESVRIDALDAKNHGNRTKARNLWRVYFQMMKSFATPKSLLFDNRVIKKKTFDYGYASSVHKLQGSSIDTIFIDMKNIFSCRNKDELRQLQYVALSRTKSDAHIYVG